MNTPARLILWRIFIAGVVVAVVGAIALTQVTDPDDPAGAAVLIGSLILGAGGLMVTFALTGWAAMLGFRAAQEGTDHVGPRDQRGPVEHRGRA